MDLLIAALIVILLALIFYAAFWNTAAPEKMASSSPSASPLGAFRPDAKLKARTNAVSAGLLAEAESGAWSHCDPRCQGTMAPQAYEDAGQTFDAQVTPQQSQDWGRMILEQSVDAAAFTQQAKWADEAAPFSARVFNFGDMSEATVMSMPRTGHGGFKARPVPQRASAMQVTEIGEDDHHAYLSKSKLLY